MDWIYEPKFIEKPDIGCEIETVYSLEYGSAA